ncbi:ABC transporter ATP-binding protein [Microbacterium sp.]|uniref:ABC transporter ATP-binding protein n=1 Tax=Microbacterium sp. TaxID=51671 RepID=UPI0039E3335F
MPSSAPLLRVRDLTLSHAGAEHPSPHGVSFDVDAGEVVLLLGPSGSGKSTLTLALNGLIPQSVPATMTGTVEVAGHGTADTAVARLSCDIAMVFQDPDAQLVTGTVLDEVAFALENLLLPVAEILERSEQALRTVGLWERRTENPDRLSGGGRQRLAIACALAMQPRMIVLDEPTANLDPQGIDDVYDALRALVSDAGRAIVLVEHNLDAAMRFATRVLVLDRDGRLAFDGPVAEVLRTHADELIEMGVWLPSSLLAARRMRDSGVMLDPLPLTPEELVDALAGVSSRSARGATGEEPSARGSAGEEPAVAPRAEGETERAAEAPAVSIRSLTVTKQRAEILHGIDLDIEAESFTAIVGANGAGKTTLVQALAGVVAPPKRTVRIEDLDAGTASPRRLSAHIGFVFQNPEHQFIAHTVRDELSHGLRLQRLDPHEIDARVDDVLGRFGLTHKADTHPFLLSGGEKRRLSVGTAIVTRPRVLALDEPTFGQDRARAAELLDLLSGLRNEGTTVVIVTHDLQLVADYATHTVILRDGRVHAAGPTAGLLADPSVFESAGLRLPPLLRMLPAGPSGATP